MSGTPSPSVQATMSAAAPDDRGLALLRHAVATLAYRSSKILRDAPIDVATFRIGPTTRTPLEILAHMGDLFDWALSMAQGRTVWRDAVPQSWGDEIVRFFSTLAAFDAHLARPAILEAGVVERLIQGPISDALTHTGQLALLRRVAGYPIRGESYARADIVIGQTGLEQAPPRWEFD